MKSYTNRKGHGRHGHGHEQRIIHDVTLSDAAHLAGALPRAPNVQRRVAAVLAPRAAGGGAYDPAGMLSFFRFGP